MTTLEEIGFLLFEKSKCHPKNLFGDDASILVNKPVGANNQPKTWSGKNIHCASIFKISTQQQNKWEAGPIILVNILQPTNVPFPGYGKIYKIILGPTENCKQYEVIIGNFPTYTCIDFVLMMTCSLGIHGKWVHCKHLYYILQQVMLCGLMKTFIHHPTWSWNEVHKLTTKTTMVE